MMPPRSVLELEVMHKRAKRSRKRVTRAPVIAPSFTPWRCVLLAVDPGNTSGWAIYACGRLVDFGTLDVFDHATVAKVVAAALRFAELAGAEHTEDLPTVLVLERPFSGRTLGASRTLWAKAWENARCVERRIVRAWPSRWRAQLFGRGAGRWPQDRARREEQRRALAIAGGEHLAIQHDAAAAICIGAWAVRAAEVGSKLPVKFRFGEVG